jgi:hypothetical protein
VNIQHQPQVMQFFARKGVKVVFLARYDPRCAPIEAAFSKLKYCLRYIIADALFRRHPHAALYAAARMVTASDACGYFRASRLMRAFDARAAQRRTWLAMVMMLALL